MTSKVEKVLDVLRGPTHLVCPKGHPVYATSIKDKLSFWECDQPTTCWSRVDRYSIEAQEAQEDLAYEVYDDE